MLIDITLKMSPKMVADAQKREKGAFGGHIGTHVDVMNKEFPLEYVERPGIVFDISDCVERDISVKDIDLHMVEQDMFVAFFSGFIEIAGYGSQKYISEHPQLSNELIDALLSRRISMIGVDFAGIRRGSEHSLKDQYCAENGVFIIENLCNLNRILQGQPDRLFQAFTFPVNFEGVTGLPCRVLAKV